MINAPESEANKIAAPATSSGIPIRVKGAFFSTFPKISGISHNALAKFVFIIPGYKALTLIFFGPHSTASDLTKPRSAVFDIE